MQTTQSNLIYMEIGFIEEPYKKCEEAYNMLCIGAYPEIKQYTHMELHALHPQISPAEWKKFLLHEKVREWFKDEQSLDIRQKVNRLIATADKNNSAQQQTLTSLLTSLSKEDSKENKTLIIYNCFVPLTKDEQENENVTKIRDIPNGIKNAIQTIDEI